MTGYEHYQEAERLIDGLKDLLDEKDDPKPKHFAAVASVAAIAQVHATLALVAELSTLTGRTGGP